MFCIFFIWSLHAITYYYCLLMRSTSKVVNLSRVDNLTLVSYEDNNFIIPKQPKDVYYLNLVFCRIKYNYGTRLIFKWSSGCQGLWTGRQPIVSVYIIYLFVVVHRVVSVASKFSQNIQIVLLLLYSKHYVRYTNYRLMHALFRIKTGIIPRDRYRPEILEKYTIVAMFWSKWITHRIWHLRLYMRNNITLKKPFFQHKATVVYIFILDI